MLNRFLKVPKFGHFPGRATANRVKRPAVELPEPEERVPSAVRIVHAGAKVEVYFMAIPAYRIMEKYPSHFITRPEVFQRPWDAVVKPEEMLALGKKYYVVPRRTVKKLRRRIHKPSIVNHDDGSQAMNSNILRSLNDASLNSENEMYVKSYTDSTDTSGRFRAACTRNVGTKKGVRFRGVDESPRRRSPWDTKKSYEDKEDNSSKGHKPRTHGKRKPKLQALTWQPSLAAITETHE